MRPGADGALGFGAILRQDGVSMRIGLKAISQEAEFPYVIAEMASAHEGQLDRVRAIMQAAAQAGADAIKFQIWRRDEIVTADHQSYDEFGRIEFSRKEWLVILSEALSLGVDVLADVDDEVSVDLAVEAGVQALKVRSTNVSYPQLLRKVADTGLPIILATGGSTVNEIGKTVALLDACGAADLLLMHGFQALPAQVAETHLRTLATLKKLFGKPVAYADHADGDSHLAEILPIAAIAAGACAIEKHITIDRENHTLDWQSSLNGPEFKRMVERLREIWTAMGCGDHELTDAEHAYRERFRKSIVARCDIPISQQLTAENIGFKISSQTGLPPSDAPRLIGKVACVNIKADTLITDDIIE